MPHMKEIIYVNSYARMVTCMYVYTHMFLLALTENPVARSAPVSHVYAMNVAVTTGEMDNEMKVSTSQDVKLTENAY